MNNDYFNMYYLFNNSFVNIDIFIGDSLVNRVENFSSILDTFKKLFKLTYQNLHYISRFISKYGLIEYGFVNKISNSLVDSYKTKFLYCNGLDYKLGNDDSFIVQNIFFFDNQVLCVSNLVLPITTHVEDFYTYII